MVIATHVMILVIGHWIADLMQEVLGSPTILLDVGHLIVFSILLQIATPWDVTIAMDLVTNTKTVQIQEETYDESLIHINSKIQWTKEDR